MGSDRSCQAETEYPRCWAGLAKRGFAAYAALLGFATEPALAAERSLEWVEKGFGGLKWYLPYNERAGEEGLRHNEALVAAVRSAVGDHIDLMFDCILANSSDNSLLYAVKLARRSSHTILLGWKSRLNPKTWKPMPGWPRPPRFPWPLANVW